jgi:hypothetical protein
MPSSILEPYVAPLASKPSTSTLADMQSAPTHTPKPPALSPVPNLSAPTFILNPYTPVIMPESTPFLAPQLNPSFTAPQSIVPSLTRELFSPSLTSGLSTPSLGLDTCVPPFALDPFTPFGELDVIYQPDVTQFVMPSNSSNLIHDEPNTTFAPPNTGPGHMTSFPNSTPPPIAQPTPNTNSSPSLDVLVNVTNEPLWMRRKRTLAYFRETFKLGDLSNVIEHWYKLEGMLSFPDIVSIYSAVCPTTCLQYLDPTRVSND